MRVAPNAAFRDWDGRAEATKLAADEATRGVSYISILDGARVDPQRVTVDPSLLADSHALDEG